MVFRNGGRLADAEKWKFMGEEIEIVSEYTYLGVILTPKMSFTRHVEHRNTMAKNSINATWNNFLSKPEVQIHAKWNIFLAVSRVIQSYGCEIWGNGHFNEVDKLQIYFLKRILKLPSFTPTYILMLETGTDNCYLYTLKMHYNYICKTLFHYNEDRLPKKLTKILINKNLFCIKYLKDILIEFNIAMDMSSINKNYWEINLAKLLEEIKIKEKQIRLDHVSQSNRFYKYLNPDVGINYLQPSKN